jgi:hypothetical protein
VFPLLPVYPGCLKSEVSSWAWWQESERTYLLRKARELADQRGIGAVAVIGDEEGKEGEESSAVLDYVVHELKGDLFTELVALIG